jgi:anti-sigma-K factor RskA
MSDEASEMGDDRPRSHMWRWIIGVIAALAIVALLAYARRDPGFDDRVPEPEDAAVLVVDVTPNGVASGEA